MGVAVRDKIRIRHDRERSSRGWGLAQRALCTVTAIGTREARDGNNASASALLACAFGDCGYHQQEPTCDGREDAQLHSTAEEEHPALGPAARLRRLHRRVKRKSRCERNLRRKRSREE